MARLRQWGPYIYATWAARLLSGANSCEWAYQFQARHDKDSYNQAPDSGDLAFYSMRHTSLLRKVRDSWVADGYTCRQEDQNWFSVSPRGWSGDATLGGKPDLIACDGDSNIIIDVKAGKPSHAHVMQVMFYMYAVPLGLFRYHDVRFQGRVVYEDHEIPIPEVDDEFVFELRELSRRLASEAPAIRVPSERECGWCKITSDDCPVRVENPTTSYVKSLPPVTDPAQLPI